MVCEVLQKEPWKQAFCVRLIFETRKLRNYSKITTIAKNSRSQSPYVQLVLLNHQDRLFCNVWGNGQTSLAIISDGCRPSVQRCDVRDVIGKTWWQLSIGLYSLNNCYNPFGKRFHPPSPKGKNPFEHAKSLIGASLWQDRTRTTPQGLHLLK